MRGTPGPWHVEGLEDPENDDFMVVGPTNSWVANVADLASILAFGIASTGCTGDDDMERHRADAILLAAAPELESALLELLRAYSYINRDDPPEEVRKADELLARLSVR